MKLFVILLLFQFTVSAKVQMNFFNSKIETRIKVAVLDSGINVKLKNAKFLCKNGIQYALTKDGFDTHGHGTHIIQIIAQKLNPKTHCIISMKVMSKHPTDENKWYHNVFKGLRLVRAQKVAFINLSLGGTFQDFREHILLRLLAKDGVIIILAAGNEADNLDFNCNFYPACYRIPGTHIVGNGFNINKRANTTNYGHVITDWRDGQNILAGGHTYSGTSQSAALLLRDIITRHHIPIDVVKETPINKETFYDNHFWKSISNLFRYRRYYRPVEPHKRLKRKDTYRMPW